MSDKTSTTDEQPPADLEYKDADPSYVQGAGVDPHGYTTAAVPRADVLTHHGGQPAANVAGPEQAKHAPQDSDDPDARPADSAGAGGDPRKSTPAKAARSQRSAPTKAKG